MSERIDVRDDGRLVRITLRAGAVNVLDMDDIGALRRAIERADDAAAVLLAAAGDRAFCAGIEVADHLPGRVDGMLAAFGALAVAFRAASPPIVAAVQGPAVGGGFELALLCDFTIASERAAFSLPESKLAALPPVACALLPGVIGERRALDFIVTGRRLDAREAEAWGLVAKVVEHDALAAEADAFCAALLALSEPALRACKRAARAGSLDEAFAVYRDDILPTRDAAEGIRAFLEKRPPVWERPSPAIGSRS